MRFRPLNWKVTAARVPLNALALAVTVLVLPGVTVETSRPLLGYLALAAIFGVLNAFVKPVFQLVALPFLLESFGLVIVLIDAVVFWLLDVLAPRLLQADGVLITIAAGALVGFLSFVLDQLLGLTPPIVDDRRKAHA